MAVTLDLKGNLSHPNIKGRVVLDDFQCRFSGLPLPIKKINGTLRFRTSGVTFSAVKGMIGESATEVSGEIFPGKMDVSGQLKMAPNDLKKLNLMPHRLGGIQPYTAIHETNRQPFGDEFFHALGF